MRISGFAWLLLPVFLFGCRHHAASPVHGSAESLASRQEFLRQNLAFSLRDQLGGRKITVGSIEESEFPGFDKTTFRVGQRSYPILVTKDDKHILLLGAEPIATMTAEERAAFLQQQSENEASEAKARAASLALEAKEAPMRGNPDAPVTIVEFSDFQCPYCRRGFDTMEQILATHSSDVRFVYMHFPLPTHPWARKSAIASACAAQQDAGAFWKLYDFYFRNQRDVAVDNVVAKSRKELVGSGIRLGDWESCIADTTSEAHAAAVSLVDRQTLLGRKSGVSGTPGFFVNGAFISGAQPIEVFEKAIEDAKAAL